VWVKYYPPELSEVPSIEFGEGVGKNMRNLETIEVTGHVWPLTHDIRLLGRVEVCDIEVEATRYATPIVIPFNNLRLG
jgi:hypothetical protein